MATTLTLIGVIVGSTAFAEIVRWLRDRKRNQAEIAAVQVNTVAAQVTVDAERWTRMEDRYDRLEGRYDRLEDKLQIIQHNVYGHQQWDFQVYRKVLEIDPDFPPPPDILT